MALPVITCFSFKWFFSKKVYENSTKRLYVTSTLFSSEKMEFSFVLLLFFFSFVGPFEWIGLMWDILPNDDNGDGVAVK